MEETEPRKLMDVGKTIRPKNERPKLGTAELNCPVCGLRRLEVEQTCRGLHARCKNGCAAVEVSERLGLPA